jgi:pimeloyl-ACP methyl ester carboxylesterase
LSFYTQDTPPFLREWHRRRVLGTPDHVVSGCFLGLFEGDEGLGRAVVSRDYLAGRTAPRLAVYASEAGAGFERSLPLGTHDEVTVVGGGHFLHQQCAEEFNRRALAWLDRLPDA